MAALFALSARAHAHPAGTSSISRLLDFEYLGGGRFRVGYVLDFAEGPAYAEIDALDADHDGALTPDEQRAYLAVRLPPIIDAWVIEIDGRRVRPTLVASSLEVAHGQGGLETLRIDCELALVARPPARGADLTLRVRDDTFADRPGWHEIRAGEVAAPTVPAADSSEFATGSGPEARDAGDARRVSDATFVLHEPAGAAPSELPVTSSSRLAAWVAVVVAALLAAGALVRRRRNRT